MDRFTTETTIREEGEIHLDHLPFHVGERVQVIVLSPIEEDSEENRRKEYEAFMNDYGDEDSIYDQL
jgi:hypothetical protein